MNNELSGNDSSKYDMISFQPYSDKKMSGTSVDGYTNEEKEEPIKHEFLDGIIYHIFLYYKNRENKIIEDEFEATLLEPLEYISQLTGTKIFGFVMKKTKSSEETYRKCIEIVRVSNYFMEN